MLEPHLLDTVANLLGDRRRLVCRDLIEDHRQLLAAVAGCDVEWPARETLHQLRHLRQTGVTSLMAVGVVVVLEIVDIDHQNGHRAAITQTLLPDAQQVIVE